MNNDVFLIPYQRDEFYKLIKAAFAEVTNNKPVPKFSDEWIDRATIKEEYPISSDTTLIKYEKLGLIKGRQVGRRIHYRRSEIQNLIENLNRV